MESEQMSANPGSYEEEEANADDNLPENPTSGTHEIGKHRGSKNKKNITYRFLTD
jgi:hypothetical protein